MSNPAASSTTGSVETGSPTFSEVYAQQFPFVWRCLRSLGVRPDQAEDAAQEVFVVVHRRLSEFRGESSLRTWLYGIVRKVAANQRRSERRRGHIEPLDSHMAKEQACPLDQTQQREAADFVQRFLDRTSDKHREVFLLAMLEQMSMPEVAQALSVPLNTAYTRLRTARLEFRRELVAYRGDHA